MFCLVLSFYLLKCWVKGATKGGAYVSGSPPWYRWLFRHMYPKCIGYHPNFPVTVLLIRISMNCIFHVKSNRIQVYQLQFFFYKFSSYCWYACLNNWTHFTIVEGGLPSKISTFRVTFKGIMKGRVTFSCASACVYAKPLLLY